MIKRILLFTFFCAIALFATAQQNSTTTSADKIVAKKRLQVKDYWISDFQNDSALAESYKLPTSKAVHDFVTGRVGGLNIVRTVLTDSSWSECLNGVCDTIIIHHVSGGGTTYTAGNGLVLQGTQFKIKDTSNGAATKLMWLFDKSAFRAGTTSSTQWDIDSIGQYSFGGGRNTKAKGQYSVAFGSASIASGQSSFALGNTTTANGIASFAMGDLTIASGLNSIALGSNTIASNSQSSAFGYHTTASGGFATAFGNTTIASGLNSSTFGLYTIAGGGSSFAMGDSSNASGVNSAAFGMFTRSKSFSGVVIGTYNDSTDAADGSDINSANRLFQIGNGTANNARHNAFTVLGNGYVGIGTFLPDSSLTNIGSTHLVGNLKIDGLVNGVKKYVALLNQSGTSAPVATVLENSFGGTIVWTRNSGGDYTATLAGAFTSGKTLVSFTNNMMDDAGSPMLIFYRWNNSNSINVFSDYTFGENVDDVIGGYFPNYITITVYP